MWSRFQLQAPGILQIAQAGRSKKPVSRFETPPGWVIWLPSFYARTSKRNVSSVFSCFFQKITCRCLASCSGACVTLCPAQKHFFLPKDHLQMPGILQRSLSGSLSSTEGDASVCDKALQRRVDLAERGQLQGVPLLRFLKPCADCAAIDSLILQIHSHLNPGMQNSLGGVLCSHSLYSGDVTVRPKSVLTTACLQSPLPVQSDLKTAMLHCLTCDVPTVLPKISSYCKITATSIQAYKIL